jgi:hypothetical protein
MRVWAVVLLLAVVAAACSSEDSGDGNSGGTGGSTGGTGGASGASGSGGSSDVSCTAWCAHFYDDLQCDPAGEAECVGDCELKKQSGDFLLAEAQCQLDSQTCAAWDACGDQF